MYLSLIAVYIWYIMYILFNAQLYLLVKLFHLIYVIALKWRRLKSRLKPYINLKGEDNWYSKTFQKCEKGPSKKFLHSKGEEWGQGKSIFHIVFMMLFYCLKVDKGERVSENHTPNLSVHTLWMVLKGIWYHKTFEEQGEIRKIKITYELFNYLYKYRPSFHHWSHGKKDKVHVPQQNEMLSLHCIYCTRFYYQKWRISQIKYLLIGIWKNWYCKLLLSNRK